MRKLLKCYDFDEIDHGPVNNLLMILVFTVRFVGLEDIELESKHLDYSSQGIKEVTYQCLKHWQQKMADLATVGTLASALCKVFSEDEVCDKLSP